MKLLTKQQMHSEGVTLNHIEGYTRTLQGVFMYSPLAVIRGVHEPPLEGPGMYWQLGVVFNVCFP